MITTSNNNFTLFNNITNQKKLYYKHNIGVFNYVYCSEKEFLSFIDEQNWLFIWKGECLKDITKCMDINNILGGISLVDEE